MVFTSLDIKENDMAETTPMTIDGVPIVKGMEVFVLDPRRRTKKIYSS